MTIAASLLLSVSLTLHPEAGLRVYNPYRMPVDAIVNCAGGAQRNVRVESMDAVDVPGCAVVWIDAPFPLIPFETMEEDGVETQRVLDPESSCAPFAVEAPLFGCRGGAATVTVPYEAGVAYAWSVEGASVVSGHGTNRLVLTLGDGNSARVTSTVTGACAATAQAVISLRNPLVLDEFNVPSVATANTQTKVDWSYAGGVSPVTQVLLGDAFDAPVVLGGDVRSYAWTPKTVGSKSVELRASYGTNVSTKPPRRRRATGGSGPTAICPAVRTSKRMEVGGCSKRNIVVDAPDSVEAGSTFTASVELRTAESAKWTVANGTILSGATSDTATVKAGNVPGELQLYVTVIAGPSCEDTVQTRIPIGERASCTTSTPTATLTVEEVKCDSITVKATFAGTPPFHGSWSDGGAPFQTSSSTLTHVFKRTGASYSIRDFRDASCSGTVTPPAHIPSIGPSASVRVEGPKCRPGAKAIGTLSGKPPFVGAWSGGTSFTTYETTIETTLPNTEYAQIVALNDADCPYTYAQSNKVYLELRPHARLRETSFCLTNSSSYAILRVDVQYSEPPFTVYWSDGVVTNGGPNERSVTRAVWSVAAEKTYTVTRVTSMTCEGTLEPERTSAVVTFRAGPRIDRSTSDLVSCSGSTSKIRLLSGVHPAAKLKWTLTNGDILSGQGTSEIEIRNRVPATQVTVEATYPDARCAASDWASTAIKWPGKIVDFTVSPATIPVGGTAVIHFITDENVDFVTLDADPATRESAFSLANAYCTNQGRDCTLHYNDKHGAGAVDLILKAGNLCATDAKTIRLTIE